jgi:hypothetical protein
MLFSNNTTPGRKKKLQPKDDQSINLMQIRSKFINLGLFWGRFPSPGILNVDFSYQTQTYESWAKYIHKTQWLFEFYHLNY